MRCYSVVFLRLGMLGKVLTRETRLYEEKTLSLGVKTGAFCSASSSFRSCLMKEMSYRASNIKQSCLIYAAIQR